jgi:hypothetical protein
MRTALARLILAVAVLLPGAVMATPASAHPNHYVWYANGCVDPSTGGVLCSRAMYYEAIDHIGVHGDSSYAYVSWDVATHQWRSTVTLYGPIWGAWAWYGKEWSQLGTPQSNIVVSSAGGGLYQFRTYFQGGVIDCYEWGNNYDWTGDCASKGVVFY